MIIPARTQTPPSETLTEVRRNEIYQKIIAVGDTIDKTRRNYSAIGTIHNNINNNNSNNNNSSHNHSNFKNQSQTQVQSQGPPVSVNSINRHNNSNIHIPVHGIHSNFHNNRHTMTKLVERNVPHNISRFNSQSLSIPPHHHIRNCLPVGPADISVPPPPFAHPPPAIQPDIGYNQMQP